MRYCVRYNDELLARTRYWVDASAVYNDLVERGKRTEIEYPFVCEVYDTLKMKTVIRYVTYKGPTQDQINQMIKEYGR